LIKKKGKLFSVFPAAEKKIGGSIHLVSHPGASVGSFVVPESLSIADSMALVDCLVTYAKGCEFDRIRITLPPTLYQRRLSNYMDFAFFKQNFHYVKRDITSILFLEDSLETTVEKFRSSHRRAVRKANEKGVLVRQENDFDSFYRILEKNLNIRHGVTPTHSLEELKHIHELFPDKINLFAAYIDDTMVAGVVNFMVNNHVVLAFYISHDENYAEYRAVNLLFYSIFDWAVQSHFKIYDFGTFTVDEEPNMGLGRFKENFGASGIFRDTIELTIK
jgi:lipid II:glycine glycyltransferase (peptidoglycan interpeptide bridge formation enzyme)